MRWACRRQNLQPSRGETGGAPSQPRVPWGWGAPGPGGRGTAPDTPATALRPRCPGAEVYGAQ
eukprot:15374060-Alexandrium_andersonii.AAC.1